MGFFDFIKKNVTHRAQLVFEEKQHVDLKKDEYRLGKATKDEIGALKKNKTMMVIVGKKIAIMGGLFTTISRKHGRFEWNGETYVYEDTNSKYGTRINGKEVKREVALKDKDVIQFGTKEMGKFTFLLNL